jgi:hypothetical protein
VCYVDKIQSIENINTDWKKKYIHEKNNKHFDKIKSDIFVVSSVSSCDNFELIKERFKLLKNCPGIYCCTDYTTKGHRTSISATQLSNNENIILATNN